MRVYTDLHIHSCLSPCGDNEMTPWNLVGMAKVNGLDVIALTDHNAARNIPDALTAGKEYGVEIIPGMEVTTREEVHLLAYFDTADAALRFGELVYRHLPDVKNNAGLFGDQLIMENGDQPAGTLDKLLINATDLSLDEVCALTAEHGGVNVPAHINRQANSMIYALGLMPPLPQYPVVEVYRALPCPEYAVKGRTVLHSSDAHRLEDIAQRDFTLEADAPSAQAVMAALRRLMA